MIINSVGVDVSNLTLSTSHGKVTFNNWDTAGQEVFGGLRDGYYIQANCAILMFDVTSRVTYNNVEKWYRDLTRVCENIPIVLVANKVDVKDRQVKTRQVTFHRRKNLQYVEISAKSNYNIDKPFLALLGKLCGDPNVTLVEELAVQPPETSVSEETMKQINEDLNYINSIPLPTEESASF